MTATGEGARPKGLGAGRALVVLTLVAVAVEFLLGIYVNLYVSCVPDSTEHVFTGGSCAGQGAVEAHVLMGILVGVLALATFAWAVQRRVPGFLGPVFGGFLGVIIAASGGYEYLATHNVAYSFLMAVGFLMASGAYSAASAVLQNYARSGGAAARWTPPEPTK